MDEKDKGLQNQPGAMMRLAIRGYVNRSILFEDRVEIPMESLEDLLPNLAEKHAKAMAAHELHMIEIEFLDEPNQNERFFRFGTDPSGMIMPIKIHAGPPVM